MSQLYTCLDWGPSQTQTYLVSNLPNPELLQVVEGASRIVGENYVYGHWVAG